MIIIFKEIVFIFVILLPQSSTAHLGLQNNLVFDRYISEVKIFTAHLYIKVNFLGCKRLLLERKL